LPGGGQLLDVSANFLSGFRDPRLIQRSHQSVSIQNSVKRTAKRLRKPTSQQRHEVESVHDLINDGRTRERLRAAGGEAS